MLSQSATAKGVCRPFLHTIYSSTQQHSVHCFSIYICQNVVLHSTLFSSLNSDGSWALGVISRPTPRRPGFDPRPVPVGFVVDRLATRQVLSRRISVFSCKLHSNNSPYRFSNVLRPLYKRGSWQCLYITHFKMSEIWGLSFVCLHKVHPWFTREHVKSCAINL